MKTVVDMAVFRGCDNSSSRVLAALKTTGSGKWEREVQLWNLLPFSSLYALSLLFPVSYFSFHFLPFLHLFPLCPFPLPGVPLPNKARGSQNCSFCELSQWVQTEPGRQTDSGAFWVYSHAPWMDLVALADLFGSIPSLPPLVFPFPFYLSSCLIFCFLSLDLAERPLLLALWAMSAIFVDTNKSSAGLQSAASSPAESGAESRPQKHFWYILSPGEVSSGNDFGSFHGHDNVCLNQKWWQRSSRPRSRPGQWGWGKVKC